RPPPECSTSPPASNRKKCDLPVPFGPSTATRSPFHTSRSNGSVSPESSSCVHSTTRLPERPPRKRIDTVRSFGGSGGGPACTQRSQRDSAAFACLALPSLIDA